MQFSRTRLSRRHGTPRCYEKATNKWAIRFTRPVGSGLQYPRTMMYGFFAKRTDPPHHPYSADYPSLPSCLRLPPSPPHSSRRSLGHAVFAALKVLFGSPTTDRASLIGKGPRAGRQIRPRKSSSEMMPRRKSLSEARMLLAVAAALPDTISLRGT